MAKVCDVDFDEDTVALVERLVNDIHQTIGTGHDYARSNAINFALRPGTSINSSQIKRNKAHRIFAQIRTTKNGPELRRPRMPQHSAKRIAITPDNVGDLIGIVKVWYQEVLPSKGIIQPIQPLENGLFVSGGLPETDHQKF